MTTYADKVRRQIDSHRTRELQLWKSFQRNSQDYEKALSLSDSDLVTLERKQARPVSMLPDLRDFVGSSFLNVDIDGKKFVLIARCVCGGAYGGSWLRCIMAFCVSDLSLNEIAGAGTTMISILGRADHQQLLDHLRSHRE